MGILGKIFGKGAEGLLDGVSGVLDKVITTDKEREEAKYKIKALVKEYEAKAQAELSNRHKYDMQSDSWLSKNIRPMMLAFTMIVITAYALIDGASMGVSIPTAYIDLIGNALIAMIGFYFGSRGYEKKKAFEAIQDLKKEREKTLREAQGNLKNSDLPKVSLSSDE